MDKDLSHLPYGEILVVEDNTSDLKLMMDILKTAGYRVRPATDGEIALRSSKAKPPDLILLDVNLPDTSGVDVCRQLKADPATQKIPVIFISALDETDLKVKAIEGGGVDYITKPFQPPEVIARIKTQMELYQLQCELVAQSAELIREINERKRIERELARHTENLEELVEQRTEYLRKSEKDLKESQRIAHVGSWRLNLRTDSVVWSEELYRICGFDPALPPPPCAEHHKLFTVDSWNKLSAALSHTMHTGNPYELELETIRQDGRAGWMWVCGEAVFDGNTLVGLRGAAQDITESKAKEKDRLKLRAQLQQAQRMESIGTLAGGISHDFNNMLSVILGHADMALEEVDPSSPFHDILVEIKEAGERSANLTRQLLAFARKQTISPKVLDLNKTVGRMLSMLQRIIGEDIDTAWIPGQGVWPVKMDPSQIDQILANLCVNARDAISGIGKVTIETANVEMDGAYCSQHLGFAPGEYVLLAVSDNGCGMDAKTQSQIFEPFFTTKGTGQGTGLGLATVYGVVKQNEGVINVYSEVGQGTTFKIYFPRFKTEVSLSSATMPAGQVEHGHETILLVEDEAAILRMTTMMLERLGYKVLSAQSPGEAISMALGYEGEIHLLITDVVMPEMNGRDLANSILSGYPNLKRLFMSGYTANVIAHHGVLDEGVNFIQKPFSREDLGINVRGALDK